MPPINLFDEDVDAFTYDMNALRERLTLQRTDRQNANLFYALYKEAKSDVRRLKQAAIDQQYLDEYIELRDWLDKELKVRKTTKSRADGLLSLLDILEQKSEMLEMLSVPSWICKRLTYAVF